MAGFMPQGIVYIGTVPWDTSYEHVRYYSSAEQQTNSIYTMMDTSLSHLNYTYIRKDSAIRVEKNAEDLYGYNYVMYKNRNYGDKYFYAFIIECNYINENTTELVIETDVMQTWMFDFVLRPGFIERMHVLTDRKFEHLVPEPDFGFNIVCDDKVSMASFADATSWAIVVQTNAIPNGIEVPGSGGLINDWMGTKSVGGGVYSKIYSGAKMYAYVYSELPTLTQHLSKINSQGGAESISNIFIIPTVCLNNVTIHTGGGEMEDYELGQSEVCWSLDRTVTVPTTLDSYTPKNNKLFNYPYSYCQVDDNNGHYTQLKWELWGDDGSTGTKGLLVKVPIDADANCFISAKNYAGEINNINQGLVFPITGKVSWVYSAYQNWSAQNGIANTLGILASAIPIARASNMGISNAVRLLGGGTAKRSVANFGIKRTVSRGLKAGFSQVPEGLKVSSAIGAAGIAATVGSMISHSIVPDSARGSSSGNSLISAGYNTFVIKKMAIQAKFARIIDQFFDKYGYEVDTLELPNITSRPYWNYIKMQGANHSANAGHRIPSDDLELINNIFNNGVTFWHTNDVGNYALDNRASTR